jgi:hypothetical protein
VTALFLPSKRLEKLVDREHDWVYIHECHPFKDELRSNNLRTRLVISRIILSWGSSVDAPVRFKNPLEHGKAGSIDSRDGTLYH